MLIGCDGIFDRLNNCDVVHSIWSMCNENFMGKDINEHCGKIADIIIRNCLGSNANDNLTCIFVCFENFKNLLYNDNNYNNSNININMILNNLRNITNETFDELIPEHNFIDDKERSNTKNKNPPENNNHNNNNNTNNNNHNNRNNNYIPSGNSNRSKSENKNINNNSGLPSSNGQRKDKRFHMTLSQHNNFDPNSTKLTSPGKPKVLSPLNGKPINKYFSPTNTSLKNFNATLINSGMSNQLLNHQGNLNMNSIEEHMQTKNKFNKSTVVNNKLDLISPKNSDINKKLNIRNIHDEKFRSLPAINLNMSIKNKN